MNSLTYYRQKRVDGGLRSGIELNGESVGSDFVEGAADRDPGLLWYLDIRCRGRALPKTDGDAIQWFIDYADIIEDALKDASKKFIAGIDADAWPVQIPITALPKGVQGDIVCSSMRRVTGHDLASVLKFTATHWKRLIRQISTSKAKAIHA
jgi:hypothetical protein